MALNLRHKVGLCATLVCIGLIVLLGGAVRTSVGIGLLGFAFSWAFGSNYRLVHWLLLAFGLILLVPAAGDAILWPRTKPDLIKAQNSIIDGDKGLLEVDRSLSMHLASSREIQKAQSDIMKDSEQLYKDYRELQTLQAQGVLGRVIDNDWGTLVGGMLLLSAGVGLLLGVKPVRQKRP